MWLNHPVKNVEAGETDSFRCIHTSRIPYERCKMMHIEWTLLSHGPLLHHHPWPKYIAAGYLYCPHVAHGLSNSRKTWRRRDYDTGAWHSLTALQCLQGWRHCRSQQGQDRAWGLQTHLSSCTKKGDWNTPLTRNKSETEEFWAFLSNFHSENMDSQWFTGHLCSPHSNIQPWPRTSPSPPQWQSSQEASRSSATSLRDKSSWLGSMWRKLWKRARIVYITQHSRNIALHCSTHVT